MGLLKWILDITVLGPEVFSLAQVPRLKIMLITAARAYITGLIETWNFRFQAQDEQEYSDLEICDMHSWI